MNSLVKSKLQIVALRIDNYIHFLVNGFLYIQKALKAILSKYNSKESLKSASYPSSGYRILTQKDFNREKVHITENDLSFRASEKYNSLNLIVKMEPKGVYVREQYTSK